MTDELRLWAISVETLRQCFAAPPELAVRLREIAATVTEPTKPTGRGMLHVLGPLLRRPAAAPVSPDVPTMADAETLLAGHYISADRLAAGWVIVRAWLDALAPRTVIPLARADLPTLEFDLVRAEVPTEIGIRRIWAGRPDIPLQCSREMCLGYMPYATVLRLVDAWTTALPNLEPATAAVVTAVTDFWGDLGWVDTGTLPPPDLVAWWTCRG